MLNGKKVVAIIPARGGSKGVPGKNIKLLHNKPLIAYAIESAKESRYIDRVIVSTDDETIQKVALDYGAEVPFLRPPHLATDTTPTLPVLQHIVNYLEKMNEKPDLIITLQPTSPFRTVEHIDNALEAMEDGLCESVVSVCEVDYHPLWMKKIEEDLILPYVESDIQYTRRQDLPVVYKMNGAIFITNTNVLMDGNLILGERTKPLLMNQEDSIDIDTIWDFKLAEIIMNEKWG